jgi:hypothetical protein
MQQYTVTPLADDGTASKYSLVPKKTGGRVKNVVVTVNDRSPTLQTTISARFLGYSVDGTLTFSN